MTEPLAEGQKAALGREEAQHVRRVLRMRAGESVELLDGERLFAGVLESVEESSVIVRAIEELPTPETGVRLILAQGLPKADKLELIAQKATELGAWALWPVETSRSVAHWDKKQEAAKRERLSRIALEAAKQSGRAHVPEVQPLCDWQQLTNRLREVPLTLVAWEDAREKRCCDALCDYRQAHGDELPGSIALVIGPEGGLSADEVERLTTAGAVPVTLGRRILRTETAGLCGLTALLCALGEM